MQKNKKNLKKIEKIYKKTGSRKNVKKKKSQKM